MTSNNKVKPHPMCKLAVLALILPFLCSFARGAVVNINSISYGPRLKFGGGGDAIVPSGPIAGTIIYTLAPSWIIDTVVREGSPTDEITEISYEAATITVSSTQHEVQVLMDQQTNKPKQLGSGSLIGSFTAGSWISNWQETFLEMSPPVNFFAFRIKVNSSSYYYGYEVLEFYSREPTDQTPVITYGTKGLGLIETTANQPLLVVVPEPSLLTMTVFTLGTLLVRRKR